MFRRNRKSRSERRFPAVGRRRAWARSFNQRSEAELCTLVTMDQRNRDTSVTTTKKAWSAEYNPPPKPGHGGTAPVAAWAAAGRPGGARCETRRGKPRRARTRPRRARTRARRAAARGPASRCRSAAAALPCCRLRLRRATGRRRPPVLPAPAPPSGGQAYTARATGPGSAPRPANPPSSPAHRRIDGRGPAARPCPRPAKDAQRSARHAGTPARMP